MSTSPTDPTGVLTDEVVLVDELGEPMGTMGKLAAHEAPGHWHAAFSAMLVDPAGRILLQRRATTKYHFGGRWTNSCCSHPAAGEPLAAAVRRRVPDELGLDVSDRPVRLAGAFFYTAHDPGSGLQEREYDRVVVVSDVDPALVRPVPGEVDEIAWTTMAQARRRCEDPDSVTPWFPTVLDLLAVHPDLHLA
ncbi:isopentenyl-diphosphate Delta-isomerase [Salsipaludibacter albus]|uniref:isopentenyl-diphosphate Delta-isomerase n=1 Tax=Salsipaludibacter albus TaxID=2849650 RepID=UPI001EE47257|nr:isopentenyl-diphosphate Delta-isomerase [Salsipaludibacter albus]